MKDAETLKNEKIFLAETKMTQFLACRYKLMVARQVLLAAALYRTSFPTVHAQNRLHLAKQD